MELAYDLTKYAHGYLDQVRDTGERYFNHPRAVSIIVATEFEIFDAETHIATLFHDCPEDTYLMTYDRILFIFGKKIANNVLAVTKMNNQNLPKEAYLEAYFKHIQKTGWQACVIKCADRLHNLRSLPCENEKDIAKIKRQINETQKFFPTLFPTIAKHHAKVAEQIEQLLNKELVRLNKKIAGK